MVQLEISSESVKILLVGDTGVGKTSLIYSLVNDEFEPKPPAKMADVTIPAEATPEKVPLCIIDYSPREQDEDELKESIRNSHVICLVYTMGNDKSLERVSSYWMPLIRGYQTASSIKTNQPTAYKPIILVASKTDLADEGKSLDKVTTVIHKFVEIEAFIEVSALIQRNIVELFSSAQKAVVYPLAPLLDPHQRILTDECRDALIKIFKLCDLDGDGLLSDHEMNLFQENCFGTPLQRDALDDLKSIIKQSTVNGIQEDSITQTGFLFIHTLSIDKGRHDFTWQVLRKFDYDNGTSGKVVHVCEDEFEPDFTEEIQVIGKDDTSAEKATDSDPSWTREHSKLIGTGLGLTLATILSIVALRYLIQGSLKSPPS